MEKNCYGVYPLIKDCETEYSVEMLGMVFYFSSEFNKNRFKTRISKFIHTETQKFSYKYNINCVLDEVFAISFYKQIEIRGFSVYSKLEKSFIQKDKIFVLSI